MTKYYTYILTNKNDKVLYTGMTDNICRRVLKHKLKIHEGFTCRYNVDKLVYFEVFDTYEEAAGREKQIKAGSRKKKLSLISKFNPNWHDLFEEISQDSQYGNEISSCTITMRKEIASRR